MSRDRWNHHGARIATGSAIVAAIAYTVLVFIPRRAEIADLKGEIQAKRVAVAQAEHAPAELARVAQELSQAKRYCGAWTAAAGRPNGTIDLLREINQLAQAAQARNLRLEPAPVESLACVWRAPVALAMDGSFPQLFRLVQDLENLSPTVQISSLEIEPASGDGQALRMTATLTIF